METREPMTLRAAKAAFFTRLGGVSEGIYTSLNCGLASGDEVERVMENRTRAAAYMGQAVARLCVTSQVHSAEAVIVEEPWNPHASPQVDGMATNRPGIVLGVLAADCAPILFADEEAGVIGAAHAGWKGALGGVIEATVSAMERLGARRDQIQAAVGPCIAQPSYEVGEDMRRQFLHSAPDFARFFAPGQSADKYQFDLKGLVAHRLSEAGIARMTVMPEDTRSDEARFFSYRRATLAGESRYGRLLSAITLA